MDPRQACLACLQGNNPGATFEAALWIAAEHDPQVNPARLVSQMHDLQVHISAGLPMLPLHELAQPLLRRMATIGFQQDDYHPLRPQAALLDRVLQRKRGQPLALALVALELARRLLDKVLQRKRGQPLALALVALELARRLQIPLIGVNFPGHFLLRVPGADHQLDPCGGRRLYPTDCRDLLGRQFGPQVSLSAEHLSEAGPRLMLQRLSRNLRQLHATHDDEIAALKDAERVLELGEANASDYLARASLYQKLDCPQAERYDLERALLLSEDPVQRLRLTVRLGQLPPTSVSLH